MAKYVVKDKVYDTDKSQLIFEGDNKYKGWIGIQPFTIQRYSYAYITEKGNYFIEIEDGTCLTCDEAYIKSWIKKADYDRYVELFGELEEA